MRQQGQLECLIPRLLICCRSREQKKSAPDVRSLFYHGQKKLQALKFHLSPSRPPREWMALESRWYVSSPRGECAHRVGGSLQKLFGCGSCCNTLGHPPRSGVSQSLSVLSILPTGDQLDREVHRLIGASHEAP